MTSLQLGTAWIGGPADETGAPLRLFCFAHAGGGATAYRTWREPLLPHVALAPVQLPGRESRLRERPVRSMDNLIAPLCDGLLPMLDRPFAVFGHSMGAAIAFEVAHELARRGWGAPVRLFVSGRRPPHLPARRPPLHRLRDEQFVPAVSSLNGIPREVLDAPDIMALVLPTLRADFELNETYCPRRTDLLRCPVTALTGDADPEVTADEMAAWRDTTRSSFDLHVFPGDHFYLRPARDAVLATVLDRLGGT
ncbi:alpha/beta fold hydrolase [Dactylosporangium sp. NPDC000244]|uniref:thioesterase II family protein n=1 Tax=Dactylosporangium sp. NPDC000244 TaxID=3154365 RepID=UPI00331F3E15